MSVDTNTRLARPTELTDASLPSYSGRHRTSEEVPTRHLSPAKVAQVLLPLPAREPGAALAGELASPRPNALNRVLGGLRVLRNRGSW